MIAVFVLISWSFKERNECKKHFSGIWKYEKYDVEYMYVDRNLEKQFEYVENGKYYYEFDIKWLTECKYQLTYKGTSSPMPAAVKIGETFTVEILNINDSITEYKTVFRDLEDQGKMVLVQ